MIQILVVDNDRGHALLAEKCLTHDYYAAVTVVGDGEDALRLLAEENYRPNLVLLDLNTRSLAAHHALRRIRRSKPKLPIVILSASSNTDDICRAYAEGANMYAEKPSDLDAFRTTIHSIAQLWIVPMGYGRSASAG
jgi:two-component system, chemotaxis family, response regulator Rcp1